MFLIFELYYCFIYYTFIVINTTILIQDRTRSALLGCLAENIIQTHIACCMLGSICNEGRALFRTVAEHRNNPRKLLKNETSMLLIIRIEFINFKLKKSFYFSNDPWPNFII